jgi:RNA polymerase primary sigma factor
MGASTIQSVVEALLADYERQGGHLSEDDVLRLSLKRSLESNEIEQVLRSLRVEGIDVETDSDVGYEAKFGVQPTQATSSPDLLGKYLREIATFRLLTAQDEVRLGRRIQAGLQAEEQRQSQEASSPELDRIIEDGRDARGQMMSANLRLVFSVARKYAPRANMDVLDLAQDGVFGLARAVIKFDPSLGFKFSTYATWWIRQTVLRAIENKGRTIRLPVHAVERLRQIKKVRRALRRERGGEEPSLGEIAEQLRIPEGKVQFLLDVAREPQSLETPTSEGDGTLGDFVAARGSRNPEQIA